MAPRNGNDDAKFRETVEGLIRGDFSRLEPLFIEGPDGTPCQIAEWFKKGYFATAPVALAEALACACFNGRTEAAQFLLDHGVDPEAGTKTGLNATHWAANRGQLHTSPTESLFISMIWLAILMRCIRRGTMRLIYASLSIMMQRSQRRDWQWFRAWSRYWHRV